MNNVSIIPLVGFSPFSHIGHIIDLGELLKKSPGTKHIGISNKSDYFTPGERKQIFARQLNYPTIKIHSLSSPGQTIGKAWEDVRDKPGEKHLHIIVGADRISLAKRLKDALANNKIIEMDGGKFDTVHIVVPQDENRSHGFSGTSMRKAAYHSNLILFHEHLGLMFSEKEAIRLMKETREGIESGQIKLKR